MQHLRFLLLLAVLPCIGRAQNITGIWEGIMSDEKIQINIEQKKNELCGFTYDYILRNSDNHCRAKFEGYYNAGIKTWFISGTKFIENSGSHVLMQIKLWRDRDDEPGVMRGTVKTKSFFSSLLGGDGDEFRVRKVSNKPNKLPDGIPPCFPEPVKQKTKKAAPQTKPVLPRQKPSTTPEIKKDTIAQPVPVITKKEKVEPARDALLHKDMSSRRQTEQSRLVIDVDHINLKLYDNGIVDNDTVSVFYNGKLLVSHQKLSEKAVELNIQLDPATAIHEITLFAENLGGIPPNTALVVVTAGKQRHELRSKASLEENAVLVFEYRKKE